MNNEEKILSLLEKMDVRQDKADALLEKMNSRLDKVDARLEGIDHTLDALQEDIADIKEDTAITRSATNSLIEWADNVSVITQVKFPVKKSQ